MNNEPFDIHQALGYKFEPTLFNYSDRDVILYALGIGAAKDSLDPSELAFVYEGNPEGFKVFPTFAVTFPSEMIWQLLAVPGLNFNPMMLLHGEQYLELKKPLPTSAEITNRGKISQIYDKGKGALILLDVSSEVDGGETIALNRYSLFIRGISGFGGDRGPSSSEVNLPPDRGPDRIFEEPIPANQALLYRLSGDRNPLHVNPEIAIISGYQRPILHGLCIFGYAARAVLKIIAGNDPARFKSIKVRFARHFFPGETLVTEIWDQGEGEIIFRSKIAERDEYVLTNARIELHN